MFEFYELLIFLFLFKKYTTIMKLCSTIMLLWPWRRHKWQYNWDTILYNNNNNNNIITQHAHTVTITTTKQCGETPVSFAYVFSAVLFNFTKIRKFIYWATWQLITVQRKDILIGILILPPHWAITTAIKLLACSLFSFHFFPS